MFEYLLSGAYNFFWFLVLISIVVFIHEYGHFIVARWNGVKVEAFSIGFGKELFGWMDKHSTRWSVRCLPFGGYVKMFGDADAASSPDFKTLKKLSKSDKEHSFYYKKLWQKALIVFAGPFANYLTAFVILFFFLAVNGKTFASPEISEVIPNSAAQAAGLRAGDVVLKIDDTQIESFEDIAQIIALSTGDPLNIYLRRGESNLEISVVPKLEIKQDVFGNEIKLHVLGIKPVNVSIVKLSIFNAATEAVVQTYEISIGMLKAIGQIITGSRSAEELGGPIKIAQYSGQSASLGINGFLWFIALISLNLGLVNLLPFPMLDGGHLFYYAVEGITRKPISEKFQLIAARIGLTLLLMLMIFVTFNDITSLFK